MSEHPKVNYCKHANVEGLCSLCERAMLNESSSSSPQRAEGVGGVGKLNLSALRAFMEDVLSDKPDLSGQEAAAKAWLEEISWFEKHPDVSASAEPQRAFGPIREAAIRASGFDVSWIVQYLREKSIFDADLLEQNWKAMSAYIKSLALLGEAPPTQEAELENAKSRYSPVEKLLRPNSPPGATVQPPSKKKESHEQ